ncbi:MAG: hypothetical protein MZW92_44045 [Comamonadaceae bacterium]|nr:hypothetical protein [Comamonadaceae bacterium]
MWVNYSSLILLFGAAFLRAMVEAGGRLSVPAARQSASRAARFRTPRP